MYIHIYIYIYNIAAATGVSRRKNRTDQVRGGDQSGQSQGRKRRLFHLGVASRVDSHPLHLERCGED